LFVVGSKLGAFYSLQTGPGYAVAYGSGKVRVMCHKETNTDWLPQPAVDQSQREMPADHSQSRSDSSHNTSIRRWQTFSPPGVADDSYVCRVSIQVISFTHSTRSQTFSEFK